MVCTPEDLRSSEATMSASGSLGHNSFEATEDSHSGLLRTQDLQEAKDQIIVEVADTLGKCPHIFKYFNVFHHC